MSPGIYSVLFYHSVQLLLSRRTSNYKLHLGLLTALFLLSTIHIALAYAWAFITDTGDTAIYELFSLKNPRRCSTSLRTPYPSTASESCSNSGALSHFVRLWTAPITLFQVFASKVSSHFGQGVVDDAFSAIADFIIVRGLCILFLIRTSTNSFGRSTDAT
jgi:hypothetical protein